MKVESYAERDNLKYHLPSTILKYYMESGGVGFCVSSNGHSRTKFVLLKYCMLPYLEVRNPYQADSSFLEKTINFGRPKSKEKLVPKLVDYLYESNGNPTAYLEIMVKFYL